MIAPVTFAGRWVGASFCTPTLLAAGWGFFLFDMGARIRNLKTLGILLLCAPGVRAGVPGDRDTSKTYQMEEVVVTATRSPLSSSRSPSRISLLSRESIGLSNGTSLGALLRNIPGLFIREYGAGGSLQTASFRGMAAEQTLVLIDGVPVNNLQLGLADLCIIPTGEIERIELARGGGSALYGANAVGGVINILTRASPPGPGSSIEGSTGSFGTSRLAFRSSILPAKGWSLTAGGSTETGSGNYPFLFRQGGDEKEAVRTNSDHRGYDLFLKSDWVPAAGPRARFLLSYASLDRGTPGPLLTPSSQGSARQADDQLQAIGSASAQLGDRTTLLVSGDLQSAYEHYVEFLSLFPADNYYRNLTFGIRPQMRYQFGPSSALSLGLELGRAIADGNALAEEKSQVHSALSISSELAVDSTGDDFSWSLFPSLRYDHFSGVDDSWSPKLGLNLRASPGRAGGEARWRVTLHSTAGRDFRPPTFNELYYGGAGGRGNPALLPERSLSFDAGVTLALPWAGDQELDATYYSISTENRIFWLPAGSQFNWSPVNIGRTTSTGVELDYRWILPGRSVELTGNYALLDARKKFSSGPGDPTEDKQLIYIPLETGGMGALLRFPVNDHSIREFTLRLAGEYAGDRYTVEDNTIALSGYFLLSGNVGVEVGIRDGMRVRLKYEVNNIANKSYEVVPAYPMPLRSHAVSISLTATE
jgi:outer membrane cobalamin receptor